jgi:hypothetical protein
MSLAKLSFEPNSKVTTIDETAFEHCSSLLLVHIPAHLEMLGPGSFGDCTQPRRLDGSSFQLIFEVPSRLKQLSLPPGDFGSLAVPDSVECVTGPIGDLTQHTRLLRFGHESRLREIRFTNRRYTWGSYSRRNPLVTVFVYLPEVVLRRFRSECESG